MLQVLHVSESFPGLHSLWGGAEMGCQRLMQALDGHVRQALATLPPDAPEPDVAWAHDSVHTLNHRFGRLGRLLSNRTIADPLARHELRKIIDRQRPDIVHIHRFAAMGWGVVRAVEHAGIPCVLSLYDCSLFCPRETLVTCDSERCSGLANADCGRCSTPGHRNSLLKRKLWQRRTDFMRRTACEANAITVLSDSWRDYLTQYGVPGNRQWTVPLPLSFWPASETAMQAGIPDQILFVGWMQPRKGLHIILPAVKTVKETFPAVHLAAVITGGEDEYRNTIETDIRTLGLSANVSLHGRMQPAELCELMSSSSVVVVPEQWPNPQPVVLCEAMSFARNIVASRIGGIPAILGEDGERGLLAEADNSDDWAVQLNRALSERAQKSDHRMAAREFSQDHFTPVAVRDDLLRLYEQISGRRT